MYLFYSVEPDAKRCERSNFFFFLLEKKVLLNILSEFQMPSEYTLLLVLVHLLLEAH